MPSFTDSAGRTWSVALTVASVKRVRTLLGVDLANLTAGDPPTLTRLATDYVLVCDVLFALCQPQAERLAVGDEEFGEAMGGTALQQGQAALMGALCDFFQSLGRTEMVRLVTELQKVIVAAVRLAEQHVEALDVESLAATSGRRSMTAPGSSVSTPIPSP